MIIYCVFEPVRFIESKKFLANRIRDHVMIKLYLLLIISLFSCIDAGWCDAPCSSTTPCALSTQKCVTTNGVGTCVAKQCNEDGAVKCPTGQFCQADSTGAYSCKTSHCGLATSTDKCVAPDKPSCVYTKNVTTGNDVYSCATQNCSGDTQCVLTQKCSNGVCVAKTEAELSTTVFSCVNDAQCQALQKCSIPSGASSGACIARTCSDTGVACPLNARVCTNLGSGSTCNPGDMTCVTPTCQVPNCANDPVGSACPSSQKCVVTKGVGACVSKTCAELGGAVCSANQLCVDPDKNYLCSVNDASCASKAVCKASDCRNGGILCSGTTPVCDTGSGQCVAPNCSNGGSVCAGGKVCVDTNGHLCAPGKSCEGAYCQAIDCATGGKCADDEVCSDAIAYQPAGSTSKGSYHKCNVVWCNSGDGICADTNRKCVNRSTCFLKTCADSNGPKCGANQICNNGTCQTICVGTGSTACPVGQVCTSPSTNLPCLSGTCVFGVCQLPHCLNGGPTCLPGNKCQINVNGSGSCVPLNCADPNGTPCANGTVCRLVGGSASCVNAVKTCADAGGDPCDAQSKCDINTDLSGMCVSKLVCPATCPSGQICSSATNYVCQSKN